MTEDKKQENARFDYAVHSNFLIHWTGKNIDGEDPNWDDKPSSKTEEQLTTKYVERLRNILEYGLWMTEDMYTYKDLETSPKVAQTCFTELRISLARQHAKKFGRLGIGVKRPFLFDRGGRPVVYYDEGKYDPFFEECKKNLLDKTMLNFFKPMRGIKDLEGKTVNKYNLYDESEWRIIKNDKLLKDGLIIDPHTDKGKYGEYYEKLEPEKQKKLKYLMPITDWLAMIIYPSIEVKRAVSKDPEIESLIKEIVKQKNTKETRNEDDIWPIEMDIDACRNF